MKQEIYFGLLLILAGTFLGVAAYLVVHFSVFEALGISIVIIGLTIVSLPRQVTARTSMKSLLRGSVMGINPLLEEIKTIRSTFESGRELDDPEPYSESKAVYLPPESKNPNCDVAEEASVYVPIRIKNRLTKEDMRSAPTKLYANESQEGIRIFTAGCDVGNIPEIKEGVTLEHALQYILVTSAELCSSVRLSEFENTVIVEMRRVRTSPEPMAYRELLGSLPSSLAASIIATVSGKPTLIEDEEVTANKTVSRFLIYQD